jgi:hypothetical protein
LIALPFLITGAWDDTRIFGLEILAELPERARLRLEVPAWLGHQFNPKLTEFVPHEDAESDPDDRARMRIPIEPHGVARLGDVALKADARVASHLLIEWPGDHHRAPHEVAVRQMYKGREVGRITWRLVPDRDMYDEQRR